MRKNKLALDADFNAGDTVRIKSDLSAGVVYGGLTLLESMAALRGSEAQILSVESNLMMQPWYELSNGFYFSEEMLEKA